MEHTEAYLDKEPAALLKALEKEDAVCADAAFALGDFGDASAVPALIRVSGGRGRDVQRDIALTLGKIGDKSAVPKLIEFLGTNDGVLNRYAAWALGEIGEKSAIPALIDALERENHLVRSSAAEALSKIGDYRPLVSLLYSERKKVRASAYKAISSMIGSASREWIANFLDDFGALASGKGDSETKTMLMKIRRKAVAREKEWRAIL